MQSQQQQFFKGLNKCHSEKRPFPTLSPDHAGNAGLPGQQRQHGVVDVLLLQGLLLLAGRIPLCSLAVQQSHGDVAVGVLVAQRGQRREGPGRGNVILVAPVVVLLPQLRVVRVVERRAQLRMRRGHGGRSCCGHGDGRDGLQLSERPLLTDVQHLLVRHLGLGPLKGHFVLQLLPELGVELAALGSRPLDDRQQFDGVFESLHFLVVHNSPQFSAFDENDFDLAGDQHVAQPRLQLKDAPAASHHVVGRHDDDETLALVDAASHILDVG